MHPQATHPQATHTPTVVLHASLQRLVPRPRIDVREQRLRLGLRDKALDHVQPRHVHRVRRRRVY